MTGVSNPDAGLTDGLLPAGRPTGGLRCQYDDKDGRPWHLASATKLTAAAARQQAASMSALPVGHTLGGVASCGLDDGGTVILVLAYPGRSDIDLWDIGSCGGVSNGYIIAGSL
jgi:hypothetical protein